MHYQLVFEILGRYSLLLVAGRMAQVRRTLARVLGPRLLLWAASDDHFHVAITAPDRAAAGHVASGLHRALSALGIPLVPATRVTPIEDAKHLGRLVGYFVRQPLKHGVAGLLDVLEATCLPELVGARLAVCDPGRIEAEIPRVDVPVTALRAIGVSAPLVPASDAQILALGARALWTHAHAALSAEPGRSQAAAAARAAFARIGREAGLSDAELRAATGTSRWAWQRTVATEAPDAHVRAVRLHVALAELAAQADDPPEQNPEPVRRRFPR